MANGDSDLSAFWLYPDWDGPLKEPFWMRPLKVPQPAATTGIGYGGGGGAGSIAFNGCTGCTGSSGPGGPPTNTGVIVYTY